VYDLEDGDGMTAAGGYRAVVAADDGRLIGFYCVGGEALVPGVEPDDEIVDLGVGMAPVFVGNGRGTTFLHAVLDDLGRQQPAKPVRALIQSWNVRSLSLARGVRIPRERHPPLRPGRRRDRLRRRRAAGPWLTAHTISGRWPRRRLRAPRETVR
jgi:RimJ/RimL family protein N-acetyltransferase